jgi:uncharacterized damage-inducible protein DinB
VDPARVRLLYEHNAWANRIVLDRASTVGRDAYFAEVPGLSFGSLHVTLLHILDGEWSWFCRMRRTPREEWLNDLDEPDLASLTARWQHEIEVEMAFLGSLEDFEGSVTYEQPEGVFETLPVWQALLHVLTHSIQFRAEAAVRLTQLGASPGDLDFNNFMDTLLAS